MKIITDHIVLLSGFQQRESKAHSLVALYCRLWEEGVAAHLRLESYRADMKDLAAALSNLGARHAMLVGYSWGGHAAIKLAKALATENVGVPLLVLCDPVRQGPLALFGFFRRWRLEIPHNVKRVVWFGQMTGYPAPWDIRWTQGLTSGERVHLHGVGHDEIDDSEKFQGRVVEEAHQLFPKKGL